MTSSLENINPEEVAQQRNAYNDPHHIILTEDHASLFLRSWPGDSETAVLILHGITAYSGPYEVIAKPLHKEGYQVFGLDLRGHGLSSGNRGDYKSLQVLHEDLKAAISYIKKTLGYQSVVVLGHSLGVYTTLNIVYYNLADISGIALFSAALTTKKGTREPLGLWEKIKIFLSSLLAPSRPVITYFREGMLGQDDPLFNFKYTLRFFKVFDTEQIEFPLDVDIPFYMAIGDEDELFAIDDAKSLFDKIHADDKKFKVLEGTKHAVFNTEELQDFVSWVKQRYD